MGIMGKRLLIPCLSLLLCNCTGKKQMIVDEINDSTTPLHLIAPDYETPYGELSVEQIRKDIERIFLYIDSVTPARVVDANGKELKDLRKLPDDAKLNQGTYRLTSYEWGVTYMALLRASEVLKDKSYKDYVIDRIGFLAESAPFFSGRAKRTGKHDGQMRQVIAPKSLDDAGAMSGALMLTAMADSSLNLSGIIENHYDIVVNKTYHLADGTFARKTGHTTIPFGLMICSWHSRRWQSGAFTQMIPNNLMKPPALLPNSLTECGYPKRTFSVTDTWKV